MIIKKRYVLASTEFWNYFECPGNDRTPKDILKKLTPCIIDYFSNIKEFIIEGPFIEEIFDHIPENESEGCEKTESYRYYIKENNGELELSEPEYIPFN